MDFWLAVRRSEELDRRFLLLDLQQKLQSPEVREWARWQDERLRAGLAYRPAREKAAVAEEVLLGIQHSERDIKKRLPGERASRPAKVAAKLSGGPEWIKRKDLHNYGLRPTTVDRDILRHGASGDRKGRGPGGSTFFRREYLVNFVTLRWNPRGP